MNLNDFWKLLIRSVWTFRASNTSWWVYEKFRIAETGVLFVIRLTTLVNTETVYCRVLR
jgi:hypothetical protein